MSGAPTTSQGHVVFPLRSMLYWEGVVQTRQSASPAPWEKSPPPVRAHRPAPPPHRLGVWGGHCRTRWLQPHRHHLPLGAAGESTVLSGPTLLFEPRLDVTTIYKLPGLRFWRNLSAEMHGIILLNLTWPKALTGARASLLLLPPHQHPAPGLSATFKASSFAGAVCFAKRHRVNLGMGWL